LLQPEQDPRLRAYVVWVPQLGAGLGDVSDATRRVPDPRARQFWDPSNSLGREYGQVLGLGFPVWDVYMLFKAGQMWTDALPPAPAYWMHQLGGVTAAPFLDPAVLARHAASMLNSAP